MRKLIKYLRPYSWWIVLIFGLLFGQAMADLSLPRYMAEIVNVGIQQGGVRNAVPEAIRASEFDKVTLFMTGAEKGQVGAAYVRLDRQDLSSADYAKYVKTYPQLADQPVYKLNTSDNARLADLDAVFGQYIPVVAAIEQGGLSSLGENLPPLSTGGDPFAALAQLPPVQLDTARALIIAGTADIPESLLKQYSTAYVSAEYKSLGMNVTATLIRSRARARRQW